MRSKGIMEWKEWVQKHILLSIILLIQVLFLLFLAVGLFRPAYSVRMTAQNFTEAISSAAGDEYQVAVDGEAMRFTIADDVKRLSIEDDTNETVLTALKSDGFALRSGAYLVTVHYTADSTSPSTEAAKIQLKEPRFTKLVYNESMTLDGAGNEVTTRLWVPLGANAQDVELTLTPRGECNFQIEEILVEEQPVYRWVRLLGFLLLFAAVDFVGIWLFTGNMGKPSDILRRYKVPFALGLVCLLACLPFFCDGILWGDDMDFHLTRIAHLAQSLQEGQFPVRMYTDMLNGYGYAAPLYYCDIFLYIPAVLFNCMLPLQTCYKIYGVLVTAATAAISYTSLRHILKHKEIAVVGTALYLLAGYRLCNVHMRAAVGEYTAMTWLPLFVWGMYKIYTHQKPAWRQWMPLAVGMAGLVLCHVISFEITCVFLLMFCLLRAKETFKISRLGALCKAAGTCVALCAWFLIPMLHSMATQKILGTQALPADFQSNGVSLNQLLALFPFQKYSNSLGALGAAVTIGTLIAVFVLAQRDRWKRLPQNVLRLLQCSLLLGVLSAVFALNAFPWNSLLSHVEGTFFHKILALAQFPWRYLTISTILLVVAAAAALHILQQNRPELYRKAQTLLLSTMVLYTALFSYNLFQVRTEVVKYDPIARDENTIGMAEYKLPGDADLNYARPQSENADLQIKWYDKTDGIAHITLENTGDAEATVTLPIFDYGNYHAVDTEGTEWPMTMSEDSLLQITVPGGYSGAISIEYKEPLLWRAAELVSLATCGGVLVLWLRDKKKRRSQQLPGDFKGQVQQGGTL